MGDAEDRVPTIDSGFRGRGDALIDLRCAAGSSRPSSSAMVASSPAASGQW
jgi:hypothetical protein